jgi:hypothetical protein
MKDKKEIKILDKETNKTHTFFGSEKEFSEWVKRFRYWRRVSTIDFHSRPF